MKSANLSASNLNPVAGAAPKGVNPGARLTPPELGVGTVYKASTDQKAAYLRQFPDLGAVLEAFASGRKDEAVKRLADHRPPVKIVFLALDAHGVIQSTTTVAYSAEKGRLVAEVADQHGFQSIDDVTADRFFEWSSWMRDWLHAQHEPLSSTNVALVQDVD